MKDEMRKSNSLVTSALRIREDIKIAQGEYNDNVSELARLTKGHLKKVVKSMSEGFKIEKVEEAIIIFDRLEETLMTLEDNQATMDEIVSVIGGLEFSTPATTDKLLEILSEQEIQHGRMSKSISVMSQDLDKMKSGVDTILNQFLEDIGEFFHDFSRFQDHIIASVPRISNLFDELDKEEAIGLRYRETF